MTTSAENRDQQNVVVIGAGIAGLMAAAAVAPHVDHVTLVEQDDLHHAPLVPRRRVPQGAHVHALLDSGRGVLDRLLPGFIEDAVAAGSLSLAVRSRWRSFDGHRWALPHDTGPVILSQSRVHLEFLIRQRVIALTNVQIKCAKVYGLVEGQGVRLTGVQIATDSNALSQLPASWVIDASGRAGQTTKWLHDLGYDSLSETVASPDVRYASMILDRADTDNAPCAWLQLAQAPTTRGLVLAPIEGGRWIATITDRFGAAVPKTAEAFLQALMGDFDPKYRQICEDIAPIGDVSRFHIGTVRLRDFESARLPSGFLPIGDAVATFNPLHAQGMSVAALQAEALGDVFADNSRRDGQILQDTYLSQALAISRNAWQIGRAVDMSYPNFQADADPDARRQALALGAAFAAATVRPDMARQVDRTLHMLDPFSALTEPLATAG
ncbi:2-polyprenyl-6-methoxyphenol hydroxylase-like FAD-dependent oxidoreductase [Yoonia maritima]|uniref:2-polyprenyl-6-methoxyphenol hydroxylase-like FAD-dependent oxidoreductase n=1 Tax=Yoonia maritima TaxID=1435347 RepID=A0A2T0VXB6_9RHOB|nr:FAD-dependent monooxygenase [Yoonia maritima]PRY76674.1 2-polyprenyl-6-methoxyphenol hydroxylase-like FAD-dependent oxidoreductase [Yoonia maritima]